LPRRQPEATAHISSATTTKSATGGNPHLRSASSNAQLRRRARHEQARHRRSRCRTGRRAARMTPGSRQSGTMPAFQESPKACMRRVAPALERQRPAAPRHALPGAWRASTVTRPRGVASISDSMLARGARPLGAASAGRPTAAKCSSEAPRRPAPGAEGVLTLPAVGTRDSARSPVPSGNGWPCRDPTSRRGAAGRGLRRAARARTRRAAAPGPPFTYL